MQITHLMCVYLLVHPLTRSHTFGLPPPRRALAIMLAQRRLRASSLTAETTEGGHREGRRRRAEASGSAEASTLQLAVGPARNRPWSSIARWQSAKTVKL